MTTSEQQRLGEIRDDIGSWRRWGPYVAERSWATVREDYSADGEAWTFFPHELARSKAYRWGEDAIGGLCDRYQLLVFAPAFWNGRDPFLKERLFGVTSLEGNHGEDVKEYCFYLDNTPTHSYMRMLYKYPQREFPYQQLVAENQRRRGQGPEFELLDTGVFDDNRYFDIEIQYAKASPEDIVIRITATNRGPEAAELHILPHLWFRNTWAWGMNAWNPKLAPHEPAITTATARGDHLALVADDAGCPPLETLRVHYELGRRTLYAPPGGTLLFTNNETNGPRVFGGDARSRKPHVKDAFHRWLIDGENCLRPEPRGTKAAIHYHFANIEPGGTATVTLRLTDHGDLPAPLADADAVLRQRRREADEFYNHIHPAAASDDERNIQRQAFASLLWTKQIYLFNVERWFDGDNPRQPPPPERKSIRNEHWRHLNSMRVMSVPDKWEYPWFAAWDLAFHCVPLALVDPQFAKDQLSLLLFEQFLHPNGQIPAYEWEFSDLNPPVHAWAVWRVYNMDRIRSGQGDRDFLESCFHKLLINFAWWINKVDNRGDNIFEGGFLGLDNIAVFDRSTPCSDGSILEQADATGWMGMYCLNLMRIALELAKENATYERLAAKFFQHYVYVAAAMKHMGGRNYQLWDDHDGFFYDVLAQPDGKFQKFRVRSLVGLVPLFAVERLEASWIEPFAEFTSCFHWFLKNRADLVKDVVHRIENDGQVTYALTIVTQEQLADILHRVCDPEEFLSPYGIRSLSKHHEREPFRFDGRTVNYEPAEAESKIKGGNSNWRGPIWFPTTFLLIESLRKLRKAFGPQLDTIAWPTDGDDISAANLPQEIASRLIHIFTRDAHGRRALYGSVDRFQNDPHWRELLVFPEYFHGDNGAGLGAAHQGWTALVASLIDEWRKS